MLAFGQHAPCHALALWGAHPTRRGTSTGPLLLRRMAPFYAGIDRIPRHPEFSHGLNRVSAIISAFIAQPFKYPLGCMALLARAGLIFCQPTIDLRNIRIKLGPLDRRCPPIPRRFGIRQHLRNTVSADPKIPSNLTPTQPVLKVSVTNLQIQIHGEYPQALPKQKGQKWPTFTPPATPQ